MSKVLCTALNAENGPQIAILQEAGLECHAADRSVNLWDNDVLIQQLQGFECVIAGVEPYPAKVLAACPELRVIARIGVGFDAIDLAECDARGIAVATTPGVNHHSVAEHTVAMMVALSRGFPFADAGLRRGLWPRKAYPRLMDSTLGLIGLGRVGQAVATRALGLGMRVIASDPYPPEAFVTEHSIEIVSLDELYGQADYISLHSPGTPETTGMINRQSIAKMKPSAVLLNTARGQLVNEPDLISALQDGRLRGAGLDVFETEPLPADNPLMSMDNVILSAHVAGLDRESFRDTHLMTAETILSLRNNILPRHCLQNLKHVTDWTWARH
ncbi:MAG: phosphoglycerate dehydrogenase [Planctomycetaceae bacterium]